jgi:hypothetical protein
MTTNARVSQVQQEVLGTATVHARVSQVQQEVLGTATVHARVSQVQQEVLGTGTASILVSQCIMEVLGSTVVFGGFTAGQPPYQPMAAQTGETITITGYGFTGASAVQFTGSSGLVNATSYTVVSDGIIRAVVPATAMQGPMAVTLSGGSTLTSVYNIFIHNKFNGVGTF